MFSGLLDSSSLARVACGLTWIVSWFTSSEVPGPIVELGYARYQGYFDPQNNITNFRGLRYAAPPVGELRFQEPQRPAYTSDLIPAIRDPIGCYSIGFGRNISAPGAPYVHSQQQGTTPTGSEDCLFLNVFVPGTMQSKSATSDLFPVMVWIHGGGYHLGSASQYDGARLVERSMNNVIVVVLQYRLGAFGFLSGREIKDRGALNAGLLDQNLALQWIQEHIGSFGGDKNHVTIWGESAGAGSVLQHVISNGGNTKPPLFNAAIASSTFLPSQYDYNHRVPQSLYDRLVDKAGCASEDDPFTCLQCVDAEILVNASNDIAESAFYTTFVFVPVVDGKFIMERPSVILSRGQINGDVLLAVTNQNEGYASVNENQTLTFAQYVSRLFPGLTSRQIQEAESLYKGHGTVIERARMVYGDAILMCPTYSLLEAFPGRSWKGLFAIPPAHHGKDIPYYFFRADNPPPYNNMEFIDAFSQSFMSLAMFHDVNVKFDSTITPNWNEYIIDGTEMVFNHTEAYKPVVSPIQTDTELLRRCVFWSSVLSETAQ